MTPPHTEVTFLRIFSEKKTFFTILKCKMILWALLSSVLSRHFGRISRCKWQVLILRGFLMNVEFYYNFERISHEEAETWLAQSVLSESSFWDGFRIIHQIWSYCFECRLLRKFLIVMIQCAQVSRHTFEQKVSLRLKLIIWGKFL